MEARELKQRLTDIEIEQILISLGGVIWDNTDSVIILNTICHGGNSANKLYYYKDSKIFHCYTHCGRLSILDIVSEVKDISIPQSIDYICTLLGISTLKHGFKNDNVDVINDWSFINGYKRNRERLVKKEQKQLYYDKTILNIFQDIYTAEWLNDGISKEIMKEYDIKYSTLQQKIIIPHFDITNGLIGVRCRTMIEEEIEQYGKYTPFQINKTMYNHPLGQNLYGIHKNANTIQKLKKVMLVESEKGVLQVATMFGIENNFTLGLCGCAKISRTQRNLLLELGVEEVIIALDRQYNNINDEDYVKWLNHIKYKIIPTLSPYFKVYVLWDTTNLLGYKESPTDKGKNTLLQLMKNKIYIPC